MEEIRARELFSLEGKVALVTGGANGLGRMFCVTLAEFGADIAFVDIDEQGLSETARLVESFNRRVVGLKGDVSDPETVQSTVTKVVSSFGRIDILVNNAGVSAKPARIGEMAIEDWDRVLAVNLRGVFLCMRAVLPVMVEQRKGSIINIGSVKGVRPFYEIVRIDPKPHYTVSKAAVISLTKEAALEYAEDGIRVNCIAPGWHQGTGLGRWRYEKGFESIRRLYEETLDRIIPMGRCGEPRELKGLLIFLASDASSYVTGQVFISDGGICV